MDRSTKMLKFSSFRPAGKSLEIFYGYHATLFGIFNLVLKIKIMDPSTPQFDTVQYKKTTCQQWQQTAEAWYRWSPTLNKWLGKATGRMLEMAGVGSGQYILDIAAGAGEQSITWYLNIVKNPITISMRLIVQKNIF